MKSIKHIILLSLGICLMIPVRAQKFSAFVDRKRVALNQTFQVSFRLEDAQTQKIEYPSFSDFQILGGPNSSSSVTITNGQFSQSLTYSFYLRPKKKGNLSIGSASVEIEGKKYSTDPIQVEVVDAPAARQNPSANRPGSVPDEEAAASQDIMDQIKENIFVRAIVNKRNVFQGEQLSITYKLYTRTNSLSNVNLSKSPSYKGFWVEELDTGNSQYKPEVYQGRQYNTAVVKRAILFPQRSGELVIEPLELEGVVKVRVRRNRRPQSIFDSFFETYQDIPYEFASPRIKINVKSLPAAGKPANFNGVVGNYKMDVTLDKMETETGDPVTMKINIQGQGNIKKLENPSPEFPPDFDVYDPKITDKVSKAGGVVKGNKSFDYLLIPRNPGEYKLPVINFSYFNPSSARYVSLKSDEFKLQVGGEAQETQTAASAVASKEDIELIGQDIRHINLEDSSLDEANYSFWASAGFWILFGLPFFIFFFFFWYRRRKQAMDADVKGTRSRQATRMAKKRLSVAANHMSGASEKEFYKEISDAVWGYLGDKLALGQSSLSRRQVAEMLEERGISEELINRLTSLLDNSEMALFAPSSAEGGMQAVYQEAEDIITQLEGQMKAAPVPAY